jgi:hypothetical protein
MCRHCAFDSQAWLLLLSALCAWQVMELDNRLQKAAADMVKQQDETRKAIAAATAAAAAAAAAKPAVAPAAGAAAAGAAAAAAAPPAAGAEAAAMLPNGAPAAAADGAMLSSVRKQATGLMQQIQSSAPGYARMLQDTLMGTQGNPNAAAAAAMGGPEHVPGQHHDGRQGPAGGHMQETELERKTRELQVGAVMVFTGLLCQC